MEQSSHGPWGHLQHNRVSHRRDARRQTAEGDPRGLANQIHHRSVWARAHVGLEAREPPQAQDRCPTRSWVLAPQRLLRAFGGQRSVDGHIVRHERVGVECKLAAHVAITPNDLHAHSRT